MPIPPEALELENQSVGINGKPTMAAAYEILKSVWDSGDRDRELGLHLFFLAWYGFIEPGYLTGFAKSAELDQELKSVINEVHDQFEPMVWRDAEMLYVFGLTAHMFGDMFDEPKAWEKRAIEYQRQYRAILPNGIDPAVFNDRGAYGIYYQGHAEIKNGY